MLESLARHVLRSRFLPPAIVALFAALLTIPFLGASGFAHSEAFRAQPAWEMLTTGDWLVIRLFEQPYLRKPPGMPWAIALSSMLFGQTEFAARLVSALATVASCLVTWWFVRRWLGEPWALIAGLSGALVPMFFWYPPITRSAEIEALHNLACLATALLVIQTLLRPRPHRLAPGDRSLLGSVLLALVLGLGLAAMLLTKGPAGLPVLGGAILASLWLRRTTPAGHIPRPRDAFAPLLVGAALGAGAFALWLALVTRAVAHLEQPVVLEPPSRFLFRPNMLLEIALLPVVALASALPHGLAVLTLPWRSHPGQQHPGRTIALAIGLSILLALLGYCLAGVSNNRYAMPALALLPASVGAGAWWLHECARSRQRVLFHTPEIAGLRRAGFLLLGVLTLACIASSIYTEHRRNTRTSGAPDGVRLGELLDAAPDASSAQPTQLWGDELVDQRPEVVIAAVRRARERGQVIRPLWKPLALLAPDGAPPPLPPVGSYLILRTDEAPRDPGLVPEFPRYEAAGWMPQLQHVFTGRAHNFEYQVFRRVPPTQVQPVLTQP